MLSKTLPNLLLLASKLKNQVEVVVSDNCSTDETEQVVGELQKKYSFRYNRNEQNIQFAGNIVKLVKELARGRYCWLLGDDDYLLPEKLEYVINVMSENDDCAYFFVNSYFLSKRNMLAFIDHPQDFNFGKKEILFNLKMDYRVNAWEDIFDKKIKSSSQLHIGIMNSIFERNIWVSGIDSLKENLKKQTEYSVEQAFPQTKILVKTMIGRPSYYMKEYCTVCNASNQEWLKICFLLSTKLFLDLINEYKKSNIKDSQFNFLIEDYYKYYCIPNLIDYRVKRKYANKSYISNDDESDMHFNVSSFFSKLLLDKKFVKLYIRELERRLRMSYTPERYLEYLQSVFSTTMKRNLGKSEKIALWGYGETADKLFSCSKSLRRKITVIVDVDEKKHGLKPLNNDIMINAPDYLIVNKVDAIIITTDFYTDEIIRMIKDSVKYDVKVITSKRVYCINEGMRYE